MIKADRIIAELLPVVEVNLISIIFLLDNSNADILAFSSSSKSFLTAFTVTILTTNPSNLSTIVNKIENVVCNTFLIIKSHTRSERDFYVLIILES